MLVQWIASVSEGWMGNRIGGGPPFSGGVLRVTVKSRRVGAGGAARGTTRGPSSCASAGPHQNFGENEACARPGALNPACAWSQGGSGVAQLVSLPGRRASAASRSFGLARLNWPGRGRCTHPVPGIGAYLRGTPTRYTGTMHHPFRTLVLTTIVSLLTLVGSLAAQESRTVIRNVRIWDGTSDALSAPSSILVSGEMIERIATGEITEEGASVIDAGGRIVIPGLMDMHTHLSIIDGSSRLRDDLDWMYVGAVAGDEAERMLMRGFTTVRDLGGPTVGLAQAIDEGRIDGPRIYSSGAFISQTSGHGDSRHANEPHPYLTGELHAWDRMGWVHLADGPDHVTRSVREVLRTGATQIKVMAGGGVASTFDPIETIQYTPEELRAAVVAARNYGTYVAVHAYTSASIRQALEAGVQCIDHGMLIDDETMQLLKEKDAFLSPQAHLFMTEPPADWDWLTEDQLRKMRQVSDGLDNEMKLAKRHGVRIVLGTDLFGARAHEQSLEFGARLKWFEPVDVLRQATSGSAELLARTTYRNPYKDGPLGVLVEGAYADLLIVDGNPLEDLRLLETPAENLLLIMKGGEVYKNTLDS